MTYWLVNEEPWRTRRRLSLIEPEQAPQPPPLPSYHTDTVVHEVPRMLENIPQLDEMESPTEMEPVDSSPSTWLLADCPVIGENEQYHQMIIPNRLDCMDIGDDNDKENPIGNYVISPKHVARRLSSNINHQSDDSSFKDQNDDIKRPLQSPRYRSAPIITSFHRDSSPSIPLRTTSPQSCV